MDPIALSCNIDAMQARDGTFPGEVTTTGAKGSTSIALASILGTGGVDLGEVTTLGSLLPMNSLAQE